MRPSDRNLLATLAVIASASQGCGPDHERWMVFTAPRRSAAKADPKTGARAKDSSVGIRVPDAEPLPPSNGVDVPMIEPQ